MGYTKLQGAMEEMQGIVSENERLKSDIVQKDKLLDEFRASIAKMEEQMKLIEPYIDLLEREPRKNYILNIRDETVFNRMKILARQTFLSDGDTGARFIEFTERVLRGATGFAWKSIYANQFGVRSGSARGLGTTDDNTSPSPEDVRQGS